MNMTNGWNATLAVLGSAMWISAAAAPLAPALRAQLDAELQAVVDAPGRELASLSVLALRNGREVYHRQFGRMWIDPSKPDQGQPAHERTMYRIASISKLITTLGVMKLREEGKLDLDRDVGDYLGYRFRNPHFPEVPVTLRMMMSHTSSLRDDGGYYWDAKSNTHLRDVFTPGGRLYGEGKMWAAVAPPGKYFQYANLPWGVIGTIMERVTGERFDRLMRRLILDPMGLPGGFHPADFSAAELADVATLYRKRKTIDGKETWDSAGPWIAQVDDYRAAPPVPRALPDYEIGTNGTLFGPQGNCRLSAAGLAKVMRMLMEGGRSDGKVILKKASVREMLKQHWHVDASGRKGNSDGETGFGKHKHYMNAWALGVQLFLDKSLGEGAGDRLVEPGGFKAMGHLGDAWGLTAAFAFDPKSRHGFIFLVGGPAADPDTHPGAYSGFYRHEERIMTALWTRAILQRR
ncbi:MAG: serine hydrolase [Betaproteobacteria bacterium]|nr:serine hydrolase [Betaproteobacteria bacterium]